VIVVNYKFVVGTRLADRGANEELQIIVSLEVEANSHFGYSHWPKSD